MPNLLLKNADVVLPNEKVENVSILIKDSEISAVGDENTGAEKILDLTALTVYAGFVDVHNHGAIGVDVNGASSEELYRVSRFLAGKGVTAWLPTLVPDVDENYQKTVDAINELMKIQENEPVAQALGVHFEGIFANEKMCGALRPRFFKSFKNGDEIKNLPRLKNGAHFITLAPEVENGIQLIKELKKQDWIISIGHTKAEAETLEKAKEAGAKHLTHFFNAMTGLHHRNLGVVGWGLANDDVTFDIIADGVHVAPEMLKLACRMKTPGKVSLISDAVLPTGLGDGDFEIWGEQISVAGGKTRNERGSIAGSVITMLDAVKMMLALGFSEQEVSQMASANPARLLGIDGDYGSIKIGKRADLVAIDEQGNARLTLVGGKMAVNIG